MHRGPARAGGVHQPAVRLGWTVARFRTRQTAWVVREGPAESGGVLSRSPTNSKKCGPVRAARYAGSGGVGGVGGKQGQNNVGDAPYSSNQDHGATRGSGGPRCCRRHCNYRSSRNCAGNGIFPVWTVAGTGSRCTRNCHRLLSWGSPADPVAASSDPPDCPWFPWPDTCWCNTWSHSPWALA